MRKKLISMTLLILAVILLAGCGMEADEPTDVYESKTITIGVSFPMSYLNYRQCMLDLLLETYGDADDIKLLIYDADGSQAQQNQDILDIVAQDVDGILLIPKTTEGPLSAVKYANEKGIPVITVDNRLEETASASVISFVGADHYDMGFQAANLLLDELARKFPDQEQWNVIELTGIAESSGAIDRGRAIYQTLEGSDWVNLLGQYNANFTTEYARTVIADCIEIYDSIHGVICQNDLMAIGCYEALAEAGIAGDVVIIGIDGQRDVVELIEQGMISGTVLQSPAMILEGMERLLSYLDGNEIEPIYPQQTYLVTGKNAAEIIAQDLSW